MFEALEIVNLIEANTKKALGISTSWKDANFEECLEGFKAKRPAPATFGQRDMISKTLKGDFFKVALDVCAYSYIDYRNVEAHDLRNIDSFVPNAKTVLDALKAVSKVKSESNFKILFVLKALEEGVYATAKDAGLFVPYSTLGKNVLYWYASGWISKSVARKLWRLNNLRNKVVHTGRAITKADARFVETFKSSKVKF